MRNKPKDPVVVLQSEDLKLRDEIRVLQERIQAINAEQQPLIDRRKQIGNEIFYLKKKRWDETGHIDWSVVLSEGYGNLESMEVYRAKQEMLETIGLSSSGIVYDTGQKVIQIKLTKGDSEQLEKVLSGLEKILPFVKPISNNRANRPGAPRKIVSIFEHTLSAGGIFELEIFNDKEFMITKTIHSQRKEIHKFDNLRDALLKIQDRYYYEWPGNGSESCYEDEDD